MPRERAGVDPLDARNLPAAQIFIKRARRAPVARDLAQFLDHKSADMRRSAFGVGVVRAVITDQRVGHRHDLPAIRWICQHLLVTGHGSVEANFTDCNAGCAKRFAFEGASVFQSDNRPHWGAVCPLLCRLSNEPSLEMDPRQARLEARSSPKKTPGSSLIRTPK